MKKRPDVLELVNRDAISRREMILAVLSLSVPAILAELSSVVMQYIDAAMVGSLGENATASIGLVSTTTWLIGGLCIALSAGFSVQTAQLIGAGRDDDARDVFRQSIIISLAFGFMMSVIAVSVSSRLPVWLGGAEEIQKSASEYFLVYAFMLPVMQLRYLCGSMLQCSGDMKTPSMLNILLCALDVVFNFIFIFPARSISLFGADITMFGMGAGVMGAAMGTAAAEICVTTLMLAAVGIKSQRLAFRLGGSWRIRSSCMKTAAKIAVPSAFEHTVMCSAYVASTLIIAPLGTVSVAANSLAVTAESFCYMPGYGIGAAATTLVGQSIGAERRGRARDFARISVFLGVAIMTIAAVIMYIIAPCMFSLLTPSAEVRTLGTRVLRIEAFAEPLYAASIVCAGAMRGAGDTLVPSILNLVGMWGIRITTALILVPHLGLVGVWIAMGADLSAKGVMFLVRLFREKWLNKELI